MTAPGLLERPRAAPGLAPHRPALPTVARLAGVDLLAPPRWAFDPMQFAGPQPLTFTPDGLMYGHIALWKTCHIAYQNMCLRPPRSKTGYAYFHLGVTALQGGDMLAVGKFVVGIGHASMGASTWAAINHYDNASMVAAVCKAHEDRHGIQLAGVRTPDCTDAQWAAARRSPGSGDWRRVEGNLEMIACLGVNTPGFPVPRVGGDGGQANAMVAAGAMPSWPVWIRMAVADAVAAGDPGTLDRLLNGMR